MVTGAMLKRLLLKAFSMGSRVLRLLWRENELLRARLQAVEKQTQDAVCIMQRLEVLEC